MGAGFSSTNPHQYDVVIIGAGSAGLTAADFALKMGARVLLVEKEKVGGDCTWYGCVPSKAFIKCAKVAHHARHGRKYGVHVQNDEVSVDMKDVTAYVQAKIDEVYQHESPEALRKKGLQVMLGAASFIDHHTIKVVHPVPAPSPSSSSVDSKKDNDKADDLQSGTQHADQKNRLSGDEKHEHSFGNGATQTIVTASSFLICTGAKPRIPALEGIKTVPFITYEDVFSLERLPERLCVLGGGPIGAELAQAFSRLGSSVTMFARALMPKEQPGVRAVMDTVFAAEGIDVVGERAVKVSLNPANRKDQEEEMLDQKKNNGKDTYSQSRAGDGMTSITVSGDSKTSECDTLLVATGRVPNISELNLQAAGVQYTSKGIQVSGVK